MSIVQELKDKKPATVLWLVVLVTGMIVWVSLMILNFGSFIPFIGTAIIFSSMLCYKFQKQINSHLSSKVDP